jgi:hypothetical protein
MTTPKHWLIEAQGNICLAETLQDPQSLRWKQYLPVELWRKYALRTFRMTEVVLMRSKTRCFGKTQKTETPAILSQSGVKRVPFTIYLVSSSFLDLFSPSISGFTKHQEYMSRHHPAPEPRHRTRRYSSDRGIPGAGRPQLSRPYLLEWSTQTCRQKEILGADEFQEEMVAVERPGWRKMAIVRGECDMGVLLGMELEKKRGGWVWEFPEIEVRRRRSEENENETKEKDDDDDSDQDEGIRICRASLMVKERLPILLLDGLPFRISPRPYRPSRIPSNTRPDSTKQGKRPLKRSTMHGFRNWIRYLLWALTRLMSNGPSPAPLRLTPIPHEAWNAEASSAQSRPRIGQISQSVFKDVFRFLLRSHFKHTPSKHRTHPRMPTRGVLIV